MKNNQRISNGPKDAGTSEGPHATAVGAIALPVEYPMVALIGKQNVGEGADDRSGAQFARFARARVRVAKFESVGLRAPDGRTWTYRGKRARVIQMLATMPQGVTQWDCLPWHTRLGGTIHALRRDGLEISTELEGDYRHARYRLCMAGCLLIQPQSSGRSVNLHRDAP